ncbi:MAG TPA: VIT1/CCC1 transporter family protein [Polyangia bacterium]
MDLVHAPPRRPPLGFGHYLRDFVYGSLDGVITTLAVITGSTGAQLPVRIGIILGLANLVADGLSMGASNYLGLKSELEQTGESVLDEEPWRHGLATLAAFVLVGSVPLGGYALAHLWNVPPVFPAIVLAAAALAAAGVARAPFVRRSAWLSGFEMIAVGVLAGGAAYLVGLVAAAFV